MRKLHITKNGHNMDESKSIVQKALRRKLIEYTMQAVVELGESLKEHQLVGYLLEDHGLASAEALQEAVRVSRDSRKFVELLLKRIKPSRIAACMPVVVMSPAYRLLEALGDGPMVADPDLAQENWKLPIVIGCLDVGIALTLFRKGWINKWEKTIMCGMKLLTMVVDNAGATGATGATGDKGKVAVPIFRNAVYTGRKTAPNICQLALNVVLGVEEDPEMIQALKSLICLGAVPSANQRLVLSVAATRKSMFHCRDVDAQVASTEVEAAGPYEWDWEDAGIVGGLKDMPDWAVDKHTWRGKTGSSTLTAYNKAPDSKHKLTTPEEVIHFHGKRPKRDIEHFFSEGTKVISEAIENPFWEMTKAEYRKFRGAHAKTVKMSDDYLQNVLKKERPDLFHTTTTTTTTGPTPTSTETTGSAITTPSGSFRKRSSPNHQGGATVGQPKRLKLDNGNDDDLIRTTTLISEAQEDENPILQTPNNKYKTYVRLVPAEEVVVKGPYRSKAKRNLVLKRHEIMREVFLDQHTLEAKPRGDSYVTFPVFKSADCTKYVIKKERYKDFMKGDNVFTDGPVVDGTCLGVTHLHRLSAHTIGRLPYTVWLHFAFRFILNIGDTGLYNALYNGESVCGIDMDETRGKPGSGSGVLSMLFVKKPKMDLAKGVLSALTTHKDLIMRRLKDTKINEESLAGFEEGLVLDLKEMNKRLAVLKQAFEKLPFE